MAREKKVDIEEAVERELTRLGVVSIPIADFREQAVMSDEEKAAFRSLLNRKNSLIFVDATDPAQVAVKVGKYEA